VQFSANQSFMAIETDESKVDSTVSILDVASERVLCSIRLPAVPGIFMNSTPRRLAFSPNNKVIAATGWSNRIHLFDASSGEEIRTIGGSETGVLAISISPDGRLIAAGSGGRDDNGFSLDCKRRIWRIGTSEELNTSGEGQQRVYGATFSHDGKILVSNGPDGFIRLVESASGSEIMSIGNKNGSYTALAISSDGQTIAGGTFDGRIYLWKLPPSSWLERKGKLTKEDLSSLWEGLSSREGDRAFRSVCILSATPTDAMAMLKERLRYPAMKASKPPTEEEIKNAVRDLDSDKFSIRETASGILAMAGPDAERLLESTLSRTKSEEVRSRVKKLLRALEVWDIKEVEGLRLIRVIWVLERIGTKEASKMLREIAQSGFDARSKGEAELALKRLPQ